MLVDATERGMQRAMQLPAFNCCTASAPHRMQQKDLRFCCNRYKKKTSQIKN